MSSATGIGVVEERLLDAFVAVDALPGGPYRKCALVTRRLEADYGVGPSIGYPMLCALARPDVSRLRLVDFHGNVGSPDFGPANPRYTECRLTALGVAAHAAEHGEGPALPIGLINGTIHVDGCRPSLDARRTIRALRAAGTGASDDELVDLVGPPEFVTRCRVEGDIESLVAGRSVQLILRPRIAVRNDERFRMRYLQLDSFPPGRATSVAAQAIAETEIDGVADVNDASAAGEVDLRVTLTRDADPEAVAREINRLWELRRNVEMSFGAPLAQVLREWVAPLGTADLDASLAIVEAAIAPATRR